MSEPSGSTTPNLIVDAFLAQPLGRRNARDGRPRAPRVPAELTPGSFITGPFVRTDSAVGYPVGPIAATLTLSLITIVFVWNFPTLTDPVYGSPSAVALGIVLSPVWLLLATYTTIRTIQARRVRRWESKYGSLL